MGRRSKQDFAIFWRKWCNFLKNHILGPLETLHWSTILVESANWLDYLFIEKEVRKVVFSLNKEKALKSYNFYLVMFQEC